MDTRLKKNRKKLSVRILLLVICVAILPIFIGNIKRYLPKENVYGTYAALRQIDDVYQSANYLSYLVEDINGAIKESEIQNEISSRKSNYLDAYNYNKQQVDEGKANGYEEWEYSHNEAEMKIAKAGLDKSDKDIREEVVDDFNNTIGSYMSTLKNNKNIEFYFEREGDEPFTNVPGKTSAQFEQDTRNGGYNDYIIIRSSKTINGGGTEHNISESLIDYTNYNPDVHNHSNAFYLRIKNPLETGDSLYTQAEHYKVSRGIGYGSAILLVIDMLIIIGLLISIKKKYVKVKENILIKIYRKLFLDIRILSVAAIVVLMISTVSMVYYLNINYIIINSLLSILLVYLIILDLFMTVETYKEGKLKDYCSEKFLILRIAKLLKGSTLVKATAVRVILLITYLTIYALVLYATGLYMGNDWNYNVFSISLIIGLVLMTLGIIYYILIVGKQINRLKICTDNIAKGNYKNDIEVVGPMILKDIAKNVINIENGLSTAVEKAVSSEKMKGELIKNVSQDLKVPLESIVNYVDLLSEKSVSEEEKEKHIKLLKEKSAKLKVLIEDLFEASKAATGAMELSIGNIDLVALLRQTIGEFEDEMESSGLQFIKRIPEEKIMVYADGRKTFRVFQNLLSNILKYSMPFSRVYIEVIEEEQEIVITFKNISKLELDFSEEEIVEIFKIRADSEKSQGSGLGLAIAKSLIEIQGGKFNISIDGDLFKAKVSLRKGILNSN